MPIILYGQADSPDIYYRCKWKSDVNCLLIDDQETATLYAPGFEYLRAKNDLQETDIVVKKLTDPKKHLKDIKEAVTTNTAFPYALAQHLDTEITVKQLAYPQREIKDEEEIKELKKAQELTQEAIDIVIDMLERCTLVNGLAHLNGEILTSERLKLAARSHLILNNADCTELIVSSGAQTSQPHNRGSGPIQQGPIIIDVFAKTHSGYYGDCTRTYVLGENTQAQKLVDAVQKAHDECVQMCVPGQSIKELYEHAKSVLEKYGFTTTDETGFIHSLGHGVGLDIHESPNLSPKNTDELKEGMVITIEPGLYYDIGARYENLVVVKEQPEVLGRRQ